MAKTPPVKQIDVSESDDHFFQAVEIRCTGADVVDLDELTPFQGALKSLSEEAYEALKKSILELGFSFPVAAWRDRNKIFILDAHQRYETLKRMRDQGYTIPKLPVIWVEATDKKDAARKLLAATSQYGKIEAAGLFKFMEDFDLSMPEIEDTYRFPEIDLESFKINFFDDEEGEGGNTEGDDDKEEPYTRKIESPIYSPKGEKPHVDELVDMGKTFKMIADINKSKLPEIEKNFLRLAAYRHAVFNYEAIAEYYSHADEATQDLMENSALVIIDFNKAIEEGFVVLSESIAEGYTNAL